METTTSIVNRDMVRGSLRTMCGYVQSRQDMTIDDITKAIRHTYILPWSIDYDTEDMSNRDIVSMIMDEAASNVTRLVRDIAQGRHGYYGTISNDLTVEEWDTIAHEVCARVRQSLSDDILSSLRGYWLGMLGADICDTEGMPVCVLDYICIGSELWARSGCGELCEALDRYIKTSIAYVSNLYVKEV